MSAPANAPGQVLGVPSVRRWSRAEFLLAALLLVLAAAAWLLSGLLATPDMASGILTGAQPMGGSMMDPWLVEAGLFLLTWMVMMAAMMLPSIVPFTVGVSRLMRPRGTVTGGTVTGGTVRGGTVTMTIAYLLLWAGTGILAYPAWQGLQQISARPTEVAVRAGAVVLLAAGAYQLTPLKRVCLRRCRSPFFLVMQHGQRATRSRLGAFQAGIRHGLYCLGCCWALVVVLLAAGAMSLAWMGAIAAVVALEKMSKRGETISAVLGGILVTAGVLLLVSPGLLAGLPGPRAVRRADIDLLRSAPSLWRPTCANAKRTHVRRLAIEPWCRQMGPKRKAATKGCHEGISPANSARDGSLDCRDSRNVRCRRAGRHRLCRARGSRHGWSPGACEGAHQGPGHRDVQTRNVPRPLPRQIHAEEIHGEARGTRG